MKKIVAIFVGFMMVFTLVGCGENKSTADEKKRNKEITIKHKLGETKIPKNPGKVAVFDFGTLDTLRALGLKEKVVAVPKQNIPSYLKDFNTNKIIDAGGLKEPNFEKINEAAPDLNIISGRQSNIYDKFKEIASTLYVSIDNKNFLDSFYENVKNIGKIFNKEKEAEIKLNKIDNQIHDVKKKVPKDKKGLIILANDSKISAYGPGSRFGLIHDVLGVKPVDPNIKTSTHGQSISMEYISEKNPDYIFVIDRGRAIGGKSSAQQVVENELVKSTNAYKKRQIIYLNPENWYLSGGGLESVSNMVKEVGDHFSK